MNDEKRDTVHLLVHDGIDHYHLWSRDERTPLMQDMDKEGLLGVIRSQAEAFQNSERLNTYQGSELVYQRFGPWTSSTLRPLNEAGVRPEFVSEDGGTRIRCETPAGSFMMDIRRSALKPPTGELMLSRLNSMGFRHSPTLLGISLWYKGGSPLSWMRLILGRKGIGSGFKPFLSDLRMIMETSHTLPADKLHEYLVKLSRSTNVPSIDAAGSFGAVLGEMHGSVMLDKDIHTSTRGGSTSGIVELFNPGKFNNSDAGSILGLSSFYMSELKKEFIKLLGDRNRINPQSGRRMRVVKNVKARVEGVDPFDLGLIREVFLKREQVIRSRLAMLRKFCGSPVVPSCVDPRLDRVVVDTEGNFMIEEFNWTPYGVEPGGMVKTLPLKDIAMVLNSLNKARYLISMQLIREVCQKTGMDDRQMKTLFLEYNMAKGDHNQVMRDFNLFRAVSRREVPFRYVFSMTVVGALWFQLVQNQLVSGYTNRLHEIRKENMLSYPKGVDTVQGIETFRSMLGLGTSLEQLKQGKVASMIGLEAELMNVVCIQDQA
ncbi:MAG: hypothetical protein JXA22_08040 [Candidatus Thermoplasmatota archaeon]|nr:hypothetical protein [Candidatus Thermoplasmatota archaeon]